MDIRLSWDLFILVFLVIIISYSLIIGRDSTLKVIIGSYIAAIAADASGNIFGEYFAGSTFFMNILKMASVSSEYEAIILVKVLVFVTMVILFAVKGAFEVETSSDSSKIVQLVLSFIYSLMSAGLILSVVLAFVSGISLVGAGELTSTQSMLGDLVERSRMIGFIVNNIYMLFAIPALTFLLHSLYSGKE